VTLPAKLRDYLKNGKERYKNHQELQWIPFPALPKLIPGVMNYLSEHDAYRNLWLLSTRGMQHEGDTDP
jgi:hypothetical protein